MSIENLKTFGKSIRHSPLFFPAPECCPPPRGTWSRPIENNLNVTPSWVLQMCGWSPVCGYQDTWGVVLVGFVPTWICAAFSRWRGRLITRLTHVSLQTPSPKLTKIPARPSSLKIISIYGFNVRSIPPHIVIALTRPHHLLPCRSTESFHYRAQWS